VTVLVNPTAGRGSGARLGLRAVARLRRRGATVRVLAGRSGADAADLSSAAVRAGPDALVVVGGDGMVHLAVQALAGSPVPLGLVPAGSGNDVARMLGLPRRQPDAAADVVVDALDHGRVREVDLAQVSAGGATRRVATVVASGCDTKVNERANSRRWPRGQARYTLSMLAEFPAFAPLPYVLFLDGQRTEFEAMLVAVGNGPSYGGGLRICTGAEPDDGLLDLVIMGPMSKQDMLRTYPRLFRGTHTNHRVYQHHRVRDVRVESPGIVAYGDGERLGPLPIEVTVEPGALRTLAP